MSRVREAEQQLAANLYGFAGFPEFMFVFFLRSLLRSATNRFFQRDALWFRFFLRKWSFLGIVRNFYLINILRVVLLMICITMAAKRSVRLLIFACQTENVRILSICT